MDIAFCPICGETREIDEGRCTVCGETIELEPAPETPPARPPGGTGKRQSEAAKKAGGDATAAKAVRPDPPASPAAEIKPPSEPPPSYDEEGDDPATEPTVDLKPPDEPPPSYATEQERKYREVVAAVEKRMQQGFDMYGLVGHPGCGKTHCLKALGYLLDNHGVASEKASREFHKAAVPQATEAAVFDYAYTGPNDLNLLFVDAGGELYQHLNEGVWDFVDRHMMLTAWLHRCKGLFLLLHLHPGHFGERWLDVDPELQDERYAAEVSARRERAEEARKELQFFKHFLLFLRALKAENGDVPKVIEKCRTSKTGLQDALQEYASGPPLDIPVMFFLTQADSYSHAGFEVSDGVHLDPRNLPMPATTFVARHLPSVYAAVASQATHFKFDFLQSYEEGTIRLKDSQGKERKPTFWQAPDDGETLLSVGLLAGFEFLVRHLPENRPRWSWSGLTARRAHILHRWLHRQSWAGVREGLLGRWSDAGRD